MSKKKYSIPPDLDPNIGTWPLSSSHGICYDSGVFDIDMPIHPEYAKVLCPSIRVGDLVETYAGEVGIIVSVEEPEGFFLQIKEANNNYYTILIGDEEKKLIGYSLKKVEK